MLSDLQDLHLFFSCFFHRDCYYAVRVSKVGESRVYVKALESGNAHRKNSIGVAKADRKRKQKWKQKQEWQQKRM